MRGRSRAIAVSRGRALSAGAVAAAPTLGDIFGVGDAGDWWDLSDAATRFQDDGKTTPCTDYSDPIGASAGQRGNLDWLQSSAASRPLFDSVGGLDVGSWDGTSDSLRCNPGIAGAVTLGFSVLLPTLSSGMDRRLLSSTGSPQYSLSINNTGTNGLELWDSAAGSWATLIGSGDLAEDWVTVVVTSSGSNSTTAYLNGTQKNTVARNLILNESFGWGERMSGSFGNFWNSAFRQMFIINRVLVAGEIATATTALMDGVGL